MPPYHQSPIDGVARPRYARWYRSDRTSHGNGHLTITEPAQFVQHERGAPPFRKFVDCRFQAAAKFARQRPCFRRIAIGRLNLAFCILHLSGRAYCYDPCGTRRFRQPEF